MKSFAFLFLPLVIALGSLQGGEPPVLEIKNKSSFQMASNGRNPFWPIGFKPTAEMLNRRTDNAGPDVPLTAFLLTSITLDHGTHFAIINGKTIQEGQEFTLKSGSQNYQIKLKSIEDGRIILVCRDQEIIVPLRRKLNGARFRLALKKIRGLEVATLQDRHVVRSIIVGRRLAVHESVQSD